MNDSRVAIANSPHPLATPKRVRGAIPSCRTRVALPIIKGRARPRTISETNPRIYTREQLETHDDELPLINMLFCRMVGDYTINGSLFFTYFFLLDGVILC